MGGSLTRADAISGGETDFDAAGGSCAAGRSGAGGTAGRDGTAAGSLFRRSSSRPLENLQPVARPDRHHHAHDGGDRNGEHEKNQQNDQTVHEVAPVVAASAAPDAMSRRWPAKA
jgi:hypothetical protein